MSTITINAHIRYIQDQMPGVPSGAAAASGAMAGLPAALASGAVAGSLAASLVGGRVAGAGAPRSAANSLIAESGNVNYAGSLQLSASQYAAQQRARWASQQWNQAEAGLSAARTNLIGPWSKRWANLTPDQRNAMTVHVTGLPMAIPVPGQFTPAAPSQQATVHEFGDAVYDAGSFSARQQAAADGDDPLTWNPKPKPPDDTKSFGEKRYPNAYQDDIIRHHRRNRLSKIKKQIHKIGAYRRLLVFSGAVDPVGESLLSSEPLTAASSSHRPAKKASVIPGAAAISAAKLAGGNFKRGATWGLRTISGGLSPAAIRSGIQATGALGAAGGIAWAAIQAGNAIEGHMTDRFKGRGSMAWQMQDLSSITAGAGNALLNTSIWISRGILGVSAGVASLWATAGVNMPQNVVMKMHHGLNEMSHRVATGESRRATRDRAYREIISATNKVIAAVNEEVATEYARDIRVGMNLARGLNPKLSPGSFQELAHAFAMLVTGGQDQVNQANVQKSLAMGRVDRELGLTGDLYFD